jgi:hypothetical protein
MRRRLSSQLDRLRDGQLVLPDEVVGSRLRETDGLSNHVEELQGNTRALAELAEGRVGQRGEPIEHGHVEEGERQRPLPERRGDPVERHAGPLQASNPARPAHVARRERIPRSGSEDPELNNRSM